MVVETAPTQRKLAAILSADVVGFSRLMGVDEVGTLRTLTAHRRIIDGHIARHGGRIVGSAGDSVLADFSSVVAALEAAVAIQNDLADRNEPVPEDRKLRFRIGINLGDVIVEQDTIFGDGVNIAARLQALAAPGGIYVSGSVFEQVKNKVQLGFRALGAQRVKNIAEPVRVYEVTGANNVRGSKHRHRRRGRIAMAAAGAGIAATAAVLLWRYPPEWLTTPTAAPGAVVPVSSVAARPVVAVLPFANLSENATDDYFSDGLAEDVIGALGRFSDLAVIARNSAFSFRGRNVPAAEIGKDLGARYLVEGSVRRAADRVRVATQLIDADSGQVRWSERYDAEIKDIFAVQDEITRGIVRALAARLNQLEEARTLVKAPANMAAYDYVLRGRQQLARSNRESNYAARDLFRKAIEHDASYAAAYVGLGHTYVNAVTMGWAEDPIEAVDQAERLAERAISRDDKDSWAFALRGRVASLQRRHAEALRDFDRAVELNPNKAEVLAERGAALIWAGRSDEGVRSYEIAERYDPNMNSIHLATLGIGYYLAGRYRDAVRVLERSAQLSPTNSFAFVGLAAAQAQLGNKQEAEKAAIEVRKSNPFFNPAEFGALLPDEWQHAHLTEGLAKAGIK